MNHFDLVLAGEHDQEALSLQTTQGATAQLLEVRHQRVPCMTCGWTYGY